MLQNLRGKIQFKRIIAWAIFFGYLISFLDTRATATGTIAFIRLKFAYEGYAILGLAFALSIFYLYFFKPNPIGLILCAFPQLVYLAMGTWWFLSTRGTPAPAPLTAFGIHFGFSILCFGYHLLFLWGVLNNGHSSASTRD